MSKLERSRLLNFLSKPRLGREIAEHFHVPVKLANLHLQRAIKSGQVLVSEKPVLQTLRSTNGKLKQLSEFFYIFQDSPILVDGWAKFRAREANHSISKPKGDVFHVRFVSDATKRCFKTRGPLTSEFDVSSARVKLSKRRRVNQLLRHRMRSTQEEVKPLSHAERIHLFQALLKEPLPFLDVHGRFGVSKQTIRGLVKNGLLTEVWGPKAIGVRFRLTDKGKIHLKELEAAARYEPVMRKKTLIQLKHRTPL